MAEGLTKAELEEIKATLKETYAGKYPDKLLKVNQKFVEDFITTLDKKDKVQELAWCSKKWDDCEKEVTADVKGNKKVLPAFKSEFCKKFFPEFIQEKKPKKKESIGDYCKKLLAKRKG